MLQIKNTLGGGKPEGLYVWKKYNYEKVIRIPEEYTEVEYIESSGTQYIDTGIICDNLNLYSEIVGNFTSVASSSQRMGCDDTTSPAYYMICSVFDGQFAFQYGGSSTEAKVLTADTNTHSFILDGANKIAKVDNIEVSLTVNKYPNLSIYLFSRNREGSSNAPSSFKMQRATFKNGDTVLFNGIPCKRNSDNVVGLYDTVSQTFKTNSGTGTFTAGSEIEATLTFIDYIVSDKETAYPDGGEKGGYWYEKAAEVNVATGEITFSSSVNNITIEHGLGKEPKSIFLINILKSTSTMQTAVASAYKNGTDSKIIATQAYSDGTNGFKPGKDTSGYGDTYDDAVITADINNIYVPISYLYTAENRYLGTYKWFAIV